MYSPHFLLMIKILPSQSDSVLSLSLLTGSQDDKCLADHDRFQCGSDEGRGECGQRGAVLPVGQ